MTTLRPYILMAMACLTVWACAVLHEAREDKRAAQSRNLIEWHNQ